MQAPKLFPILAFNLLYLTVAGIYFAQALNFEFVIYVAVIIAILGGVLGTITWTRFPSWQLWLLSIWGLLHVLGGAVETVDGVLFAYRIYPLLDLGGEFYILKYDQIVHCYLYGIVGMMLYHLIRQHWDNKEPLVFILAVLAAVGVGVLNEIMEFFISLNLENGVGGYDNTMLDMIFNLLGAIVATSVYAILEKEDFS